MRGRLALGLLVGSLGALTFLSASASARHATRKLHARTLTVHLSAKAATGSGSQEGPLAGIALDGTHAAYVAAVRVTGRCQLGERLYRWNLATGRRSLVSGGKTCAIPVTSTGRGIAEIALTRTHSAWTVSSGGNTESAETLFSSTKKPRKDKELASSDRFGDDTSSSFTGTWIGGLVSDGARITYATWSTAADGTVTESSLWRVAGSTATAIASDSGAVAAASANGGRIALLGAQNTVAVYSGDGRLLETIAPNAPADWRNIALSGRLVAVLTAGQNGRADSIDVYDWTTGMPLHSWPAAGGDVSSFDAYGGIAVYVKGSRVHALDLRSGKDVVVAKRTRAIQGVRLDRAGLLYYFDLRWSAKHGQSAKLVFVPFRTVAARLRH